MEAPDEHQPKNVIFVIDTSEAMAGSKIEKVRESLVAILDQLNPDDMFMLALFDDTQRYWPKSSDGDRLMAANTENIKSVKEYISEKVEAASGGGSNINDALVGAIRHFSVGQNGAKVIVFLSDGHPTVGETNTDDIQGNIDSASAGGVSLFCLGFGFDVNLEFLKAISFRNGGMFRRIYGDVSAPSVKIQLQGFMDSIGN